jgi:NAD(P) transhydrogenase subunit beta
MDQTWINILYLIASVLFILGMKGMTHPRTAVRGNLMSAIAMLIAIVAVCFEVDLEWWLVIAGLVVGGSIGAVMAIRVQMTGMPELVAFFNGMGGAASLFVAWAEIVRLPTLQTTVAGSAAGLIGSVTLTGSLIAFAKLAGIKPLDGVMRWPAHQAINALLLLICLALGGLIVASPEQAFWAYPLLAIAAAVLGVSLVVPIGGADMPVVIALLNSYSGLAAAATGFVISNTVLIIAGSLVGASGLILTAIMCKAMNRSLTNVLFGGIDAGGATSTADEVYEGRIKATSGDEVAMLLEDADRVVIVPGYGMAVAQAQHAVRDLFQLLEGQGRTVEFAIHPVAGRMPGHMNVLLAEVDIPYDKLVEAETINPTLETCDVAIVLGANDVVNPDARKSDSPIAGMPIVDIDKARTVVVVKRSLSPGFAGIPNPLFAADNALMYFADGKQAVQEMVNAVKENM